MKKWIILLTLISLTNCNSEKGLTYFTNQKAASYFKNIEELSNKDNGSMWGTIQYGPLMFVDRESRKIYANMPDKDGLLRYKDGIYTGVFPKELVIGNTGKDFGGVFFAIVPLGQEENEYRLITRAFIELNKCFLNTRGFKSDLVNTRYMNQKNARLWLKLEWKALRNAFLYEGDARQQALRDALIFRSARKELFRETASLENKIEIYEGLSNYTSVKLSTADREELKTKLIEQLDMVYGFQSYAYGFGTLNGGLYSYFLDSKGFDFSSIVDQNTDLAEKVRLLYNIDLPEISRDVAGSIALNYDIDGIYREEEALDEIIKKRVTELVGTFTEKPVVYIDLLSPYFGFEPEDVNPLDTLGTLYNTIRVSDNWGKLTVDQGGCLVSNNLKSLRITARNLKDNKSQISGDGWTLLLNSQWKLEKVDQDYFIRRTIP